MCVAQFRYYVNASRFKRDENGSYSKDIDNPNIEVRDKSYLQYKHEDGSIYKRVYYSTDLKRMEELAKQGNSYAINHLKNL